MIKAILIFQIILSILFCGCSPKSKTYYFDCNEQTPTILYSYFPQAISSLGYEIDKIVPDSNLIIVSKPILTTNKKSGIETQSIRIKFRFMFDSDTMKSEITQFYVISMNGKEKVNSLNEEQLKLYEKDIIVFQEKLLFYCNPQFKGR